MNVMVLSNLCAAKGLALAKCSKHHYQICDPSMAPVVDVWPGTNRFRLHRAKEGRKADMGNEEAAVRCASIAISKPVYTITYPELLKEIYPMTPKPLPDAPGWWMKEGCDPVEIVDISRSETSTFLRVKNGNDTMIPPQAGRWLPVELPKFPERLKCHTRLCWATYKGKRLLAAHLIGYGHCDEFFIGSGMANTRSWVDRRELTDIVYVGPEFLDELPPK